MPNNNHNDNSDNSSDNCPSEGDPDSEDKQTTESGTESNLSSKQEQSAESAESAEYNSSSDNSPSEGDPDSEDKQNTESGTESNSSSKQEQSAEYNSSSDNSPSEGSGTESNSSSKEQSSKSKTSSSSSDKKSKKRDILSPEDNSGSPTFPVKLHLILSNPEFEKIVAWLHHGRAWRILDHKALEEKVIPLYFRHGRYSSFARQINGWGFKRIVHGADYNAYYHEMFLRGMPHLSAKMKRPTSKSTLAKEQVDSSDPTPDFYAMSRLQPLPEPGSTMDSPPMDDVMDIDKVSDSADQSNAASDTDSSQLKNRKSEVIDHIAQLLNKNTNTQQQKPQVTPNLGNTELSQILSLLNGGQGGVATAAPVVPPSAAAVPQNQPWQQLLAGLSGNYASDGSSSGFQGPASSSNPQAQLAALLQKQLQSQQQQAKQQNNPQTMLAALLGQNQNNIVNQADLLSTLTNQVKAQNGNQGNILSALMNNNGGQNNQLNPAILLQALSGQLLQSQQQNSSAQSLKSSQSQKKQQYPQESSTEQSSEEEGSSKHKAEDSSACQGAAKRQRQAQDEDVSTACASSSQGPTNNFSSGSPNIAALLGQLSGGQNGGGPSNAVAGALSQLISSMSQKDAPANKPNPLDILNALRQPSQQQQPQNNNVLSNMLSALQQRGNQNGYTGPNNAPQAPTEALLAALQQQNANRGQQGQDPLFSLLQQLLNQRQGQQAQSSDSSIRSTGNPVLDAIQRLTTPQQPAAAAPVKNTLSQLQQLLAGQNQAPSQQAPAQAATMRQQPSRNNGGHGISAELLSSLGLKNGDAGNNNPAAAMLQQLLNSNNSRQSMNQQQFDGPSKPPTLNAEYLAQLGLSNGQSSGAHTPSKAHAPSTSQQSQSKPQQPVLNQEFLASLGLSQSNHYGGPGSGNGSDRTSSATSGASGAPSGQSSSSNGSASLNSDLLNSIGLNQNQGQSSRNQQNDESAARSVAAILSAFNKGNNQES